MMPLYADQIGATKSELGLIVAAPYALTASLAIPFGLSSDKLGRKRLILFGAALSSLSSFLLIVSKTPIQLLLAYGLGGFARAAYTPTMYALVGDLARSGRAGQAFGWLLSSLQLGMAIGSLTGGFAAQFVGYQSMFILSGVFFLLSVAMATFIRIQPTKLIAAEVAGRSRNSIFGSYKTILANQTFWAFWLAELCLFFGYSVVFSFFQLYYRSIGINQSIIGLLYALSNVINTITLLSLGNFLDRMKNPIYFLIAGFMLVTIALASIPMISNFVIIVALMAILGLGSGTADLSINTLLTKAANSSTRCLATGVLNTCLYAGLSGGPVLYGELVGRSGLQNTSLIAATITAGGAIAAVGIFYISRGRQQK